MLMFKMFVAKIWSRVFQLAEAMTVVLLGLKLGEFISWPWVFVLLPPLVVFITDAVLIRERLKHELAKDKIQQDMRKVLDELTSRMNQADEAKKSAVEQGRAH